MISAERQCSFVLKVSYTYTNNLSVAFRSNAHSTLRFTFGFLSVLQSQSVKSNLNGLFYFPHILINA